MTIREFRLLHTILKGSSNFVWKYGFSALINFQFHLLARIDDTTQLLLDHLRVHDNFAFAMKTKLNWSKNVQEERDAPWQIVLGAMDPVFCVLISLAVWLEFFLLTNPTAGVTPYVFGFQNDTEIPSGGVKAKNYVQSAFGKKMFNREEFISNGGPLGSHSIRKLGSTHVRRSGATKDEKDIRGRWKGKGRVSDVYDDIELPYPDAKVAEKLCIGGACKYVIRNGRGVSDAFILQYVVPNIASRLPDSAALVLGKALLWLIYSVHGNDVPAAIRNSVRSEYDKVRQGNDNTNPINKIPIIITGDDGVVYIDEINGIRAGNEKNGGEGENGGDGQGGGNVDGVGGEGEAIGGGNTNRNVQDRILSLQAQVLALRRALEDVAATQERHIATNQRQYLIVNGNVKRIAQQPNRRVVPRIGNNNVNNINNVNNVNNNNNNDNNNNNNDNNNNDKNDNDNNDNNDNIPYVTTLSPNPRTLHMLWEEYTQGIGTRKAAQLFSAAERGRVKHKYHRRKVVWDLVASLVRTGLTANVALDRIYAVYGGGTSVTTIINCLKLDKCNGTLHQSLCI